MSNRNIGEQQKKPKDLTPEDLNEQETQWFEKARDAIESHKLFKYKQIYAVLGCCRQTLANNRINRVAIIEDMLTNNRIQRELSNFDELPAKEKHKILADDEDYKRLVGSNVDVTGELSHVVEIVDFSNLNLEDEKDD